MFDTTEFDHILEKLEQLEDEVLAAQLLKKFSEAQSKAGKLILNRDSSLDHDQWKQACDDANAELNSIIEQIEKACL
jgi:sensor histidine kinase regulating citrate/malate metabolism